MRRVLVVLTLATAGCAAEQGNRGANRADALVATDVEAPGANCEKGGTRLRTGLDSNSDGALDDTEVDQITLSWGLDANADGVLGEAEAVGSTAICNGANGPIQVLAPIAAGEICEAGGFTLSQGHDADGDGNLDAQEIEGEATLCNGLFVV